MVWKVELSEEAERFLSRLLKSNKNIAQKLINKIYNLSDSPRFQGKPLRGDKKGIWRYRVGDYRILCTLQDQKMLILVLEIGHRKDIYRD